MLKQLAAACAATICLGAAATPALATLSPAPKPAILSFRATPTQVSGAGGALTLAVIVKNAKKCVFGGSGQVTKSCAGGHASVVDNIPANSTAAITKSTLWVYATGVGGRSARKSVTFTEAAAVTSCVGTCKFTFPSVDDEGVASITLNGVSQAIAWPNSDPYSYDLPTGDQLDAVNLTLCAGPSGIRDAEYPATQVTLALANNQQGQQDFEAGGQSTADITNDGAVGPNQCVTGNLYLDVPGGISWTTANYSFDPASFSASLVYVWHAS
jgi:hypothetical protein